MVQQTSIHAGTSESRTQAPLLDALAGRFYALLTLPNDALERALGRVIQAEHELPEPARYEAALSRVRAWLALDPEDQRVVANAYEHAIAAFPAEYANRRQEAERAVIMNSLTFAQFRTLAGFLPWLQQPQYLAPGDDARPPAAMAVA